MRILSTCFVLLLSVVWQVDGVEHNFRCDYTYFAEADGWLKLHKIPAFWPEARLTCLLEGATLASPVTSGILKATKSLMSRHLLNSNTSSPGSKELHPAVYTGFHSTYAMKTFASLEGIPLAEVRHHWRAGSPFETVIRGNDCLAMGLEGDLFAVDGEEAEYPFVCYKEYTKMKANECGTVDDGYIFEPKLRSCYKYHETGRPWREAYKTCAAEGGHLVVANGNDEADFLRDVIRNNPVETPKIKPHNCEDGCGEMENGNSENVLLVGVSRLHYPWMLLTIHEQTPFDAGFSRLGQKHLDNEGKCVAIDSKGFLIYVNCNVWYRFVCEKKPEKMHCDQ